ARPLGPTGRVGREGRRDRLARDALERTGLAGDGIADRHADETLAKVEGEQGPRDPACRHACPAAPESRAGSMPSNAKAAGKRSSAGTSKISPGSAASVSQELRATSSSSWPGPQPE